MDCILCGTVFEASQGPCPQCGWDADDVRDASAGVRPGELIRGRYEVDCALGAGRLGSAVKALDLDNNAEVVVKLIHRALVPDEQAGRNFLRGMRPLIRSAHPFMNRVLDVNVEGDRYFVVFTYIDGIPLRRLMTGRREQGQCFTLDEFFPVIKQMAQFFHESDVDVHGSISPENVWIQPQHIKLLDVGLATCLPTAAVAHRLGSREEVRGYVAPETRHGRAPDQRSDVYSLGVLLGEMLTQARYDGRPEMFQQMDPDLPAEIDAILRRALLSDPRGRHRSASELLESIAEIAGLPVPEFARSEPSSMRPTPSVTGPPPDDELSQPAAPLSGADFGLEDVPDTTVQVSMADVIRAHAENEDSGMRDAPVPLVRPSSPPPPHRSSTTPPPARHSSTPPPARAAPPRPSKRQIAQPPPTRRPSTPAPRRSSVPPPAPRPDSAPSTPRRPSAPPPLRRSSVPPPPAAERAPQPPLVQAPPAARAPQPIAPRRPSPLRRDTVPPPPLRPVAPPPGPARADDALSMSTLSDDEDTAVHRARRVSAPEVQRREVTQEIDLDEMETVDDGTPRREVTQEVDVGMIESVEHSSMKEAVDKLEAQANAAETASAEELLRRAAGLEGVDPRFVRAAHTLEADRLGASSRRAAEVLKSRAAELEGIDPRLLRAAARLEEAQINKVSSSPPGPIAEPDTAVEEDEGEDDWRERLATSAEDSVISFIAPPVVERSSEVRGFPRTVQRSPQPRPPTAPPRPPAPAKRAGRRREPQSQRPRAAYDDSGETDDESQPTIRTSQSSVSRLGGQAVALRRLRAAEIGLLVAIGLLLAGMAVLTAASFALG